MRIVVIIVTVLLTLAAALTMVRVARGPSILDRVVAVDALLVIVIGGLGTQAAYHRDATTVPLLVVLSLVGFVASTAVARLLGEGDDE